MFKKSNAGDQLLLAVKLNKVAEISRLVALGVNVDSRIDKMSMLPAWRLGGPVQVEGIRKKESERLFQFEEGVIDVLSVILDRRRGLSMQLCRVIFRIKMPA